MYVCTCVIGATHDEMMGQENTAILYWTHSATRSQCRLTSASVMWPERHLVEKSSEQTHSVYRLQSADEIGRQAYQ